MASLNGVTINPSNIEAELIPIGDAIEAANGSVTHMNRGDKWQWTITWERVSAAIKTQIRTIALLTGSYTFVDDAGASWTVKRQFSSPYTASFAFFGADGLPYYNVTLKLRQE